MLMQGNYHVFELIFENACLSHNTFFFFSFMGHPPSSSPWCSVPGAGITCKPALVKMSITENLDADIRQLRQSHAQYVKRSRILHGSEKSIANSPANICSLDSSPHDPLILIGVRPCPVVIDR